MRVLRFVVGSPASAGVHVRVDDAVYSVARVYRSTFDHGRSAWLDLRLFEDKVQDVDRVELQLSGESAYALVREGEEWRLEDPSLMPEGYRFDSGAARALVNTLVTARARDIVDEDPGEEKTGLGDGADVLSFRVGGGEGQGGVRTLRLGSEGDDNTVYARSSSRPDLFTVPAYLARNLRKSLTDLRDLSLMRFDPSKARRLKLVKGETHLVFEREGDQWRIAESTEKTPDDFELDPAAVRRRLAALAGVRALAEAPEHATHTGLRAPSGRAVVTLDDGSVAELVFGRESEDEKQKGVFARGNADDRIYLVHTYQRDRLLGGLQTFARREEGGALKNLNPEALKNLPPEVRESLLRQMAEKRQRRELLEKLHAAPEQK